MKHFLQKHWVVLAAFTLSFLLTIFISPEDAVIAQTTVNTVTQSNNGNATEFSELGIAEDTPDITTPSLDFGF